MSSIVNFTIRSHHLASVVVFICGTGVSPKRRIIILEFMYFSFDDKCMLNRFETYLTIVSIQVEVQVHGARIIAAWQ